MFDGCEPGAAHDGTPHLRLGSAAAPAHNAAARGDARTRHGSVVSRVLFDGRHRGTASSDTGRHGEAQRPIGKRSLSAELIAPSDSTEPAGRATPSVQRVRDDAATTSASGAAEGAPSVVGIERLFGRPRSGAVEATATPAPASGSSNAGSARADVAAHAKRGIEGTGGPLPFSEQIQRAFGPAHDVSTIRAHVGGDAAVACAAIHAQGYATGNDVAFATPPSLHLAAHEAAHVAQQRAGVQLAGGTDDAGGSYEAIADAVAERVVRGESASDLLPAAGAGHSPGAGNVQRRPPPSQVRKIEALLDSAKQHEKLARQARAEYKALATNQQKLKKRLKELADIEAGRSLNKWQTWGKRGKEERAALTSKLAELTASMRESKTGEMAARRMAAGYKQQAIDLAIDVYKIDVSKVSSVLYNPEVDDEGLTTPTTDECETPLVEIGDGAFRSPGWLGSSLAHEVEVHVNKQQRHLCHYADPLTKALFEVEAYDFELSRVERFGTDQRELAELGARRKRHYSNLTPKYQGRADNEIYKIDMEDVHG